MTGFLGIYVCGNTSTSSGLTITMTRDGSEYALEAGALLLADQGCCCIDEFDKMSTQHAVSWIIKNIIPLSRNICSVCWKLWNNNL